MMPAQRKKLGWAGAAAGLFLAVALTGCADQAAPPRSGAVTLPVAGHVQTPVESIRERQFATVVAQQYDFSCGSAALATLLSHHYGRQIAEAEVFQEMWEVGDHDKIRRLGFSMLDMKRYLAKHSIASDGFRVGLEQIEQARMPGLVLIDLGGYRHFVVLKGVSQNLVLVGDPAFGVKVFDRAEFERMWNGIIFVLHTAPEAAQASFNREEEWALRPRAPLRTGQVFQSLSSFTLGLQLRQIDY